ncbi:MMPL family transporter [Saccharomonospora sp. NPDC046836]|uniref:MMPL family transporter n=1 Tax=Saccharomonospora sp. NPDC046836 TaxID=3156921 RepID=UPI0033CB721F
MATYLYRLGRFAFRRRGLVASLWLALLIAAGAGAVTLSGPTSDAFSIPGTESQQAFDLLEERFPQSSADGATAQVVFQAPQGEALGDAANRDTIERTLAALRSAPQVAGVSDPFAGAINPDGTIGYAQVGYEVQAAELSEQAREALTGAVDAARQAGLTVEIGGDAAMAQEEVGSTEILGVGVAAIVLVITFGSLVAAGLPLLTALIGVGIGIAGITAATGFLSLSSSTSILAMMLGLAVAIDYALFILSRYRHELHVGRDPEEAAARAVGTAGSAVVFAGLTVVIALAGLAVVGIPFLTQMGIAAAVTVVLAVLIALTLLPALLGFARRKVLGGWIPGLRPRDPEDDSGTPTVGRRWARFIVRRRVAVLVTGIVGLGVLAIPALDLEQGMPDASQSAPDSTQRKAYDLLSAGFGPGFNGPLMLVVDGANSADPQAAASAVAGAVQGLDGVAAVAPAQFNPAGDTALLTVIPGSGPSTQETADLVTTIRDQGGAAAADNGASVSVTGQTAMNIDVSAMLSDALLPYLTLIIGLAFVLLMLVFRSVLVPLKATLGFLLTVGTTFGAVVAVFQWGWLAELFGVQDVVGPIISILPIFMIGVVFGLAMDYQVFLVTRMREEHVHGAEPLDTVVTGFSHGARVVSAAAIIMISVFAGFILSPEPLVRQIGFGLAFAVFIDAFVVRMTLVPAVLALIGRSAWWLPRWLDRILPNVDVEGAKLQHRLTEGEAEPEPVGAAR